MNVFNFWKKKEERSVKASDLIGLMQPPTYSGVSITEHNALTIPAVYSCVRLLAESIASLPCILYSKSEGRRDRATYHPAYKLLKDSPNQEMSAFTFWEMAGTHLNLWGNFYAYIARDNAANPVELIPLMPDRTSVERIDGRLVYRTIVSTSPAQSNIKYFELSDMLHIRGLTLDGSTGLSPVAQQREALGLAKATEQHGATWFGKGSHVNGMIEHPGRLSDAAAKRLRESWNARHSGLDNAHKVAILEEGMKFSSVNMPNKDAEWLSSRNFQVSEIARIFRVPAHLIGSTEASSTYSNVEQQNINFTVFSLRPWLRRIEQEINLKLLTETEKQTGTVYAEFLIDSLMRGDTLTRFQAYQIARSTEWLSVNEIRERENLNPIEGGDVFQNPNINTVKPIEPVAEPVAEPKPKPEPVAEDDIVRNMTYQAVERVVRKEYKASQKKATDYRSWMNDFSSELQSDMRAALNPFSNAADGAIDLYKEMIESREEPISEDEIRTATKSIVNIIFGDE